MPPNESELRKECSEFIGLLRQAVEQHNGDDIESPGWSGVREMLQHLSRSRTAPGLQPVGNGLVRLLAQEAAVRSIFAASSAATARPWPTRPGRPTSCSTSSASTRPRSTRRPAKRSSTASKQEMLELSTPVVKLWDGILALPMIGTLDSARTQIVMESLLQKIVETGSAIAIIDITGVPTVDTLTAQHLLKTVTAARLMGAECIISGIRPQIAQTIVHLGVDLGDVITKASLADAFALALERTGRTVVRVKVRK